MKSIENLFSPALIEVKIMNDYKVYYHKVPREISKYSYDKYYFGISRRKDILDRWGIDGSGYKRQPFLMQFRNTAGIILNIRYSLKIFLRMKLNLWK